MKSISILKTSIFQNQNLWILASIILLIPILFFPISEDLSIYILGGEAILHGKKLYVDFIDLKPPLFYYYFAGIVKIFGRSEIGVRFFDFILQSITAFLIFKTVKIYTKNTLFAGIACVLYPIIYASIGYASTLQGEALITPVTIAVLLIQKYTTRNILRYVTIGLLVGFAIGIKYPLGIILFFVLFDDIFSKELKFKQILLKNFIVVISAFSIFILSLFPLLDKQVFDGFLNMTNLVAQYSKRPSYDIQFIKYSLNAISDFLGSVISYFVTGSVLVSIFYILMHKIKDESTNKLLTKSLSFILFFIISIFVERKFHEYYFLRMLPLWVILSAFPISELAKSMKLNFRKYSPYSKFVTISILCLGLYFSPAVRYANRLKTAADYMIDKTKYDNEFGKYMTSNNRVNWLEVANFINLNSIKYRKTPFLLNIQTGSSPINYFTPKLKHSIFQQDQFFISIEAPQIWKNKFLSELTHADYIALSCNDILPTINGHFYSSQAYFFEQKGNSFADKARKYILNNFTIVFKTPNYVIYERKNA